jgi:hypothetical protein
MPADDEATMDDAPESGEGGGNNIPGPGMGNDEIAPGWSWDSDGMGNSGGRPGRMCKCIPITMQCKLSNADGVENEGTDPDNSSCEEGNCADMPRRGSTRKTITPKSSARR